MAFTMMVFLVRLMGYLYPQLCEYTLPHYLIRVRQIQSSKSKQLPTSNKINCQTIEPGAAEHNKSV